MSLQYFLGLPDPLSYFGYHARDICDVQTLVVSYSQLSSPKSMLHTTSKFKDFTELPELLPYRTPNYFPGHFCKQTIFKFRGKQWLSTTELLPVSSVRNLSVYIDSDVAMWSHITATVRSCLISALRQLRSVRRCLPQQALLTLVRALSSAKSITAAQYWSVSPVTSWVDFSPSSTPLPDSSSRRGDPNTSRRYSAIFTSCGSRSVYSFVSVF